MSVDILSLTTGLIVIFKALFGQKDTIRHAHALYGVVVARARDAVLFHHYSIPDTLDGRFEALIMHLYVLHARLKDENLQARKISQRVFDLFIDDMDAALREAGVGDQVVPKRIAKMTQVFYGRTGAYEDALASSNPIEELTAVIDRNLFPTKRAPELAKEIAIYFYAQVEDLGNKNLEMITAQYAIFDQPIQ